MGNEEKGGKAALTDMQIKNDDTFQKMSQAHGK